MSERIDMRGRSREDFPALDALRGIAAVCVVLFHLRPGGPLTFSAGYLAVDLFFLLSGFVIAHAYGEALSGSRMSFREFAKVRFIRLWPLYALASFTTGIIWIATGAARDHGFGGEETQRFISLAIAGFFFVPRLWEGSELYPLLPVAWSLFYEILVNLVFALWPRSWSVRRLKVLVAASFIGALIAAIHLSGWDRGWRGDEAIVAIPRTFASFFAGVLLYRFRFAVAARVPKIPVFVLLVTLVIAMNGPAPQSTLGTLYGFIFSSVISPVLVIFAVVSGPSRFDVIHRWLGEISYPVYVLQNSAKLAGTVVARLFHVPSEIAVFAMDVTLLITASLIVRVIDLPVRRWLARRLLTRPAITRTPAGEEAAP